MDNDLVLARQLQEEFDRELAQKASGSWGNDVEIVPPPNTSPSKPLSIVDPSWDMTDPNPDIRALFLQYNEQYFWGQLAGIEVRWSPRMTLCAGLCCYEGRGGLCSVRLSTPLLKLRPRKDLVETLLHEMIHAYLFVTQNNKDHDGHGPEFQKHMNRINNLTGTKISIYHNFHDEVAHFRQHWWRCSGPCKDRKPYFGYVKRAMNRAPSPKDFWWAEHQKTCGGTYTKIKEPDDYGKKKGKSKDMTHVKKEKTDSKPVKPEKAVGGNMDIRIFGGKGVTLGSRSSRSSTDKPAIVTSLAGTSTKSETTENGQTVKTVGSDKPSASVSREESDNSLPILPELNPGKSLLERISGRNCSKSLDIGDASNNIRSGMSDEVKHFGKLTSTEVSSKKKDGNSSGDASKNRTDTYASNNHEKDKNSPPGKRLNNFENATSFSGGGQVLGHSSGDSGGKGLLAMLRKSWSTEKSSEKNLSNGELDRSRDQLDIPPPKGHRKRNSSEFCDSDADSDFKKSKTENYPEQSVSKVKSNHDSEFKDEQKQTDTKQSNPFSKSTPKQTVGSSGVTDDVIVIGSPLSGQGTLHACPVCQTQVKATLMNEHLDRCLGI